MRRLASSCLLHREELQVSLDKRDGSHWELFDCIDSVSEKAQTIECVHGLFGESNCNKIYLGKGVSGTILEMPSGVSFHCDNRLIHQSFCLIDIYSAPR
jgi:hypothetical protein